jgi:hypothetical protein
MSEGIDKWPLRHISIRVPWHDDGWRGTVCKKPEQNFSCLKLSRISDHRANPKKAQCEPVSGRSIQELDPEVWPCCVPERAMFMAPFEYTRMATHPYVQTSPETHGHFDRTPLRHPSYSAPAIPFRWMFREGLEERGNEYGIDVDAAREPEFPNFDSEWVQDEANQRALTDCFAGHLKPDKSLCFFYAKEVPFVEDSRRVIIGVGWVKHVGEPTEYRYSRPGKLRSILWERMVQHSIRAHSKDGFLMPYYGLMDHAAKHEDFDPSNLTAFAPSDYFDEFSYASELVSHDAAIEALNNCVGALTRANGVLPGNYGSQIKWLHDRLGDLWKMRGPCPGFGAALCAFGIELGTFVAREIETKVGDNEDPWPVVERAFHDPRGVLSNESAKLLGATLREKWKHLAKERKALLKLLSRFNLSPKQAEGLYVQEERERLGIRCADKEIIGNPYLIHELTRLTENPVSVWTVDRGMFPEEIIRRKHPLPEPSVLDGGTDVRRVRGLTVWRLEKAADEGHTLQRKKDVVLGIRDLDISPKCPVDSDLMDVAESSFQGAITLTKLQDGSPCYQLSRLADVGKVIRESVNKRRGGVRHLVPLDWRALLDRQLGVIEVTDKEAEDRARIEKSAALKELAESRFSVLIGSAGTGKTTVLSILCSHPQIAKGEVLLLAPTGKARVKMEQAGKKYGAQIRGYTIAQFLLRCDRYDGETGRYKLSSAPKEAPAKTVIVDECSMLTEEMLAALLDSLKGVERLILVGDPRQLPPIGAGRPFVDIVEQMAPRNVHSIFPRVGPGYAELTVRRRQGGSMREDVQLAEWFTGGPLEPGEDEVLDSILFGGAARSVAFKTWETPEQFRRVFLDTLREELGLTSESDLAGFDLRLGAKEVNGYRYYNVGCASCAEDWQILSPVRKLTHGTLAVNRLVHEKFRADMVEFARRDRFRKIPKPMGPEQIVYGDKVINVRNHYRKRVYPEENAAFYIANGETGIVVGQFRTKKMTKPPWLLKVEFCSQLGFTYDFSARRDFGEEAEPDLELAYALTVHKAQGSEFLTVILCFPNPCRLLSRELLYTALTRQRDRIVVLHQGPRSELRKFTGAEFSETARRLTNLFEEPRLVEHKGKFYEERLIHKTLREEMVRSKSELVIADRLHSNGVEYIYEHPLTLGGHTRYPDFTIEDSESGRKIYWEHCGLLIDPTYRKRWEGKLKWYRDNGILPWEEGGGSTGTLIVTKETEEGGISSLEIEKLIRQVIKL